MLVPGHCLGILGGGQLGRMFALAATAMGYNTIVLDPDKYSPAARVAMRHIQQKFDDEGGVELLSEACDAITLEFENVPVRTLMKLAQHCPTYPGPKGLELTQNRCVEKNFLRDSGLDTVEYYEIPDKDALANEDLFAKYLPGIIKTARFGYDGKGQARVKTAEELRKAFETFGDVECILEEEVDLDTEVSVIVARDNDGKTACYPVSENIHRNGILHASIVPARVPSETAQNAMKIARTVAEGLDFRGVLGVELFVTKDGRLLVNEVAPRPHNSGHYTIDACRCSQFEQMVRIMSDQPCGSVKQIAPVVMMNILGDVWNRGAPQWKVVLEPTHVKTHIYDKNALRSQRKMGHFCVLGDNADDIDALVDEAEMRWRQLSNIDDA